MAEKMITELPPNGVFVFGSNECGFHRRGAALYASQRFGAVRGVPFGIQGQSFAIPTKSKSIKTLPPYAIQRYVAKFIRYACAHIEMVFYVSRIGCGEARYTDIEIAPMFANAPNNCILPDESKEILDRE